MSAYQDRRRPGVQPIFWLRKCWREPGRNVITRAIGPKQAVVSDIGWEKCQENDIYLMCSDGLNDMLSDEEIASILASDADIDNLVVRLIDAANEAGGKDNASVVLCQT